MKKAFITILIILIVISIISIIYVYSKNRDILEIQQVNKEYEVYLDKQIYGTDVTSIINRAMDSNEKNGIETDENGFFIDNGINSIKVEIKMLDSDNNLKEYQMETIKKVGINQFTDNFNIIDFKVVSIQYHEKSKLVSKIIIEQIPEQSY